MITKERLQERHNQVLQHYLSGKSSFGSQPQPMYSYGNFNEDNWNGGDGIIRQFTKWLEYRDQQRFVAEFDYLNFGYEMVCRWDYYEDVSYITIILRKYQHDLDEPEWSYDSYLITYYKDRGTTESIQLNGKLINVDEYCHLLNIIEGSGYKFDMGGK